MLPCVQVNHRYGKTRVEETEEWSICLGDEAHDCEQEGEATSQGSVISMGILSIHLEVAWSIWTGKRQRLALLVGGITTC